jgi:hypothetical protein
MTDEQFKQWKEWYLSPSIDYRKVYGDAFVWTEQERQLMVLLKLNKEAEKNVEEL